MAGAEAIGVGKLGYSFMGKVASRIDDAALGAG
jgi:hypothetical protein